ncbi:peptidoglycan DD-metalloendopeptidase family protein [Kovacikia minuta CCNUW1]|uniref:peptidoglycan DD-metalloendopeptidase family protein n=1 Tax=Kovacikia minuta TaxID=2931930 RepID=UPI001CCA44EA|nr:peptidoglycan DD-metalloendopeptidase family protein [Kovacikia minuta]UBF28015.1 peptidoglycan DD-metalloendopeptidase family protein [Kovacikia minuta CCNUW1]
MKRAFPQKVKPVPSCVSEDTVVGQPKQALPEVNRRARTSAAMIGLAISMGAHSILIAHQDEAIAAEPTPGEPAVAATPSVDVATLSSSTEVIPSTATLPSSGVTVIEYTVQEGQTLWQLAQFYGVDAAKVAALNQVPLNSVLQVGQVLKIPVSNRAPSMATSVEVASSTPGSYSAAVSKGSPAAIDTVAAGQDASLKAEQDRALARLQQKREDLKLGLTKLKATQQEASAPQQEASAPMAQAPAVLAHRADAYEASNVSTYQVAPGDTLTKIARTYGISPARLAAANKLDNPDVIRVSQVLVIPPSEADSQARAFGTETQARATTTVAMLPTAVATDVPVITSDTKPDSVLVPIRQTAQPGFKARIASLPGQESSAEDLKSESLPTLPVAADSSSKAESAIAAAPFVANPASRTDESASNLSYSYVENLKQEILKLREKYRSTAVPLQSDTQSATKVAATTLETNALPSRINPEFEARGYSESLRNQVRNLKTRAQGGSAVDVSTPSADTYPASARSASGVKSESQLVATAPVGSQTYEPLVPSSLGQMVTPDLPPLGSVDNYLPGHSGKFNGYIWPTKGVLTSGYGWRWGRMHKGIDIAAPVGTPVVAAAPGVVVTAGWNSGGYGNLVEIKHPDGSLTLYAHNNRVLVREGQQVEQGQQIAEMGSTGYSTGPHCHFEVHPAGQGAMNPMAFLPRVG